MDKKTILGKLAARTPLFDAFPRAARKRIVGTESEYGVHTMFVDTKGNPMIASNRLPLVLQNGGEVYEDCGHIEYASPETSNPASAVAYYEAGKRWCWSEQYSSELYCNNNDWNGNTFGAHENYFTCAPRAEWFRLIPFLIARTALCGAGWLNEKNEFEISQRAHAIQCAYGTSTTTDRPLINIRPEPLARVPGFARLHLIYGDATMSEVSTFLRLGMTHFVLEMLEMGVLPNLSYNENAVADDIKAVSLREWRMRGITYGPRDAREILALYLRRAQELFSGRDEVTDALLVIWEDTLEKLVRDPMMLSRRLDWAAKLFLLNTFAQEKHCTPEWLRSQDLAYHSLNPAESLYYFLLQNGEMERIVSDELIIRAMYEPPADTRAYARGASVRWLTEEEGERHALCTNSWDHVMVIDAAARGYSRIQQVPHPRLLFSSPMLDPREPYACVASRVRNAF